MVTFGARFLNHSNYFLDIFSNPDKFSLLHMLLIHARHQLMISFTIARDARWLYAVIFDRRSNLLILYQEPILLCWQQHFGVSDGSFNLNGTRKLCLYILQMPQSQKATYSTTTFSFVVSPFT